MRTRATVFIAFVIAAALAMAGHAQQLDICGCKNNPGSLGAFDTLNAASYPPGTISAFRSLQIPLSADGVMVFSSMNIVPRPSDSSVITVSFIRNASNTPVTLLVDGNVTIGTNVTLTVSGDPGSTGSLNALGVGGNGGPGGGRGGDGAYQLINFATAGGAGLRPGGGAGSSLGSNSNPGGSGIFQATSDLLPLIGGAGGGGGGSTSNATSCAGGGGGGGGGALLIAANGTVTVNGTIIADGGDRGGAGSQCASPGGAGSGGAIRILANTLTGSGTMDARAGLNISGIRAGTSYGVIRMETLTNTFPVSNTDPLATRTPGPGPVFNVLNPTVAITSVGGQAVPANPVGITGGVDIVLPVPGSTPVVFSTNGVPVGTIVQVTVKPKVGAGADSRAVTLQNCSNGSCIENATFDLAAGSYFIEARATFSTP